MTPAAFATLREACGMSQQACADTLRVHLNSIQGWEAGRSRIPPGAAAELLDLDRRIGRGVDAIVALRRACDPRPDEVQLAR